MMSYYNQTTFSATEPQTQAVFVDINNPPQPVPVYGINDEQKALMPFISALCAMEIQNKANQSNLRMHLFNMCAMNAFNNESYRKLLCAASDWIHMQLMQRRYQSPEQALTDIVPQIVQLWAASQVRTYPDLMRYLDQNVGGQAQLAAQQLDAIGQEVANFMAQQQQRPHLQGRVPYGGQAGGNQSWAAAALNRGAAAGGWEVGSAGMAVGTGHSTTSSSPMYGSTVQQQRHHLSVGEQSRDRFSTREQVRDASEQKRWEAPVEIKAAEDVQYRAVKEPVKEVIELAHVSKKRWRRSERQPYPLAYAPSGLLLYLKEDTATGTITQVLKDRETLTVDYDTLRVSSTFGPSPRTVDPDTVDSRLVEYRQALSQVKDTELPTLNAGEEKKLRERVLDENWVLETNLETCWTVGLLGRFNYAEQNPAVYHRKMKIATPTFDASDETIILRELAELPSLVDLRERLIKIGTRMNPELWTLIDQRITVAVNRCLQMQLSIAGRIGSFVQDLPDLHKKLRPAFGDLVADAFASNERKLIRSTIGTFDEESVDNATDLSELLLANLSFEPGEAPIFTYLVTNVTTTYLDLYAQELDLQISVKEGSLITASNPFMIELAKDIFENVVATDLYEQHFIRTKDGHVIELARGLLGSDAYIVAKVK